MNRNISTRGCGKLIVWNECPHLENKFIEDLLETVDIDTLVKEIVSKK